MFLEIVFNRFTIRSISKCFESDIEDLPWYRNKIMWKEYLDMLVTNRFNRFTFTLGMQYNYPYGNEFISDVYFYLAYPFLVQPKGYKMHAVGINKKTRDENLKILKFISDEASLRGLDFQLAIWTHVMILMKCQMQITKLKIFPKIMQNTAKIVLKSYLRNALV